MHLFLRCQPFCREMFKSIRNYKKKASAPGYLDKQRTEQKQCKYFSCGSEDHLIYKSPEPPKDNKKPQKQVRFSERGDFALQKDCENSDNCN